METWSLLVKKILPEAEDTVTIQFERTDKKPISYQAGQFLTFLFDLQNRPLRRSYSFSSTPGTDPVASITVKRLTNGEVSRHLLNHLRAGDVLQALPPAGRFTLEPSPYYVFIAAGSGMVPVFSLLKEARATQPGSRVLLISQQHNANNIIFKKSLEDLHKTAGDKKFRWLNILSSFGRLNNEWLLELLEKELPLTNQKKPDFLFYICGPPPFMRMVQFCLHLLGFNDPQIRTEHFTVEYLPPPPLLPDSTAKKIMIYAGDQTYRYEVAWPLTILQAGLNHHVPLPYSCRGGRCSSCVAKCISGRVKMSTNEVLTDKDIQNGLVLTCVGYAETDLELQY